MDEPQRLLRKSFEDAAALLTSTLNLIESDDTPMESIELDRHTNFLSELEDEWDEDGGAAPLIDALACLFTYFMMEMVDDNIEVVREQILDSSKRAWKITDPDAWVI